MTQDPDWLRRFNDERRQQVQAEADARAEVKRAVAPMYGELGFEEPRYYVLTKDRLCDERRRNNVDRPTGYGALIDDLLTTAAYHLLRAEKLEAELAELKDSHGKK